MISIPKIGAKYFSLIVLIFLFCPQKGIGQTIHGVIIGDTDLVDEFNVLEIIQRQYGDWCFDDSSGLILHFPCEFNISPFTWDFKSMNGLGMKDVKIYFAPKTMDTVRSCRQFDLIAKFLHGCNAFDTITITEHGYGIKPDSLVLIRPKLTNVTMIYDTTINNYVGSFNLLLTNNTASDVSIKQIEFQIDTNSKVEIASVKDKGGNYPLKIASESHKEPIKLELKSTLSPQKFDQQFNGMVLFHLSRLGKDSTYSSSVNVTFPAYIKSIVLTIIFFREYNSFSEPMF